MTPGLKIDEEANCAYISLLEDKSTYQVQVQSDLIVDMNDDLGKGQVLGVECLNWSKWLDWQREETVLMVAKTISDDLVPNGLWMSKARKVVASLAILDRALGLLDKLEGYESPLLHSKIERIREYAETGSVAESIAQKPVLSAFTVLDILNEGNV